MGQGAGSRNQTSPSFWSLTTLDLSIALSSLCRWDGLSIECNRIPNRWNVGVFGVCSSLAELSLCETTDLAAVQTGSNFASCLSCRLISISTKTTTAPFARILVAIRTYHIDTLTIVKSFEGIVKYPALISMTSMLVLVFLMFWNIYSMFQLFYLNSKTTVDSWTFTTYRLFLF